jgi:RNA polymerase sigma-70 factor (ECF subfamily)
MVETRPESDDDLMRDFQAGNVEAFEELVGRYHAPLYAFADRFVGDRSAADDVVQEAFLRVYEERADYIASGHFRAWLYTIARNLCLDRLRRRDFLPLDLDMPLILWSGLRRTPEVEGWEEETERSMRLEAIGRAANELPARQREAVLLKYYHGLKVDEIAEVQECPAGTVKSRLHYGLRAIRKIVADEGRRS